MAVDLVKYSSIDGVPLYYWRTADGQAYPFTAYSTEEFRKRLVRWVRCLRNVTAEYGGSLYGDLERIVTAGVYVNRSGQHGEGTAFDLDQITWTGGRHCTPYWRVHEHHRRMARRRYLAVDAVSRRYFRYVLDGWYNSAHADHIHFDFGGLPQTCSTGSTSDTIFVQAACNNFMDAGLVVDGAWGAKTDIAFERSKTLLSIEGDPHTSWRSWRRWLRRAAACGFTNKPFGYYTY